MGVEGGQFIKADVRKYCPALKERGRDLPGDPDGYIILIDPTGQSQQGKECPLGARDEDLELFSATDDGYMPGYPQVLLDDAVHQPNSPNRFTGSVVCGGCQHLEGGFEREGLTFKSGMITFQEYSLFDLIQHYNLQLLY